MLLIAPSQFLPMPAPRPLSGRSPVCNEWGAGQVCQRLLHFHPLHFHPRLPLPGPVPPKRRQSRQALCQACQAYRVPGGRDKGLLHLTLNLPPLDPVTVKWPSEGQYRPAALVLPPFLQLSRAGCKEPSVGADGVKSIA